MDLVDVHAHLESSRFSEDLDEVILRAKKSGVKFIINSGVNPSTNRKALELSEKYDIVKASFGLYPVDSVANLVSDVGEGGRLRHVEKFDVDKELDWIRENKKNCVAIGEVGLDYDVLKGYNDEQKAVFEKVLDLALEINLPVIIHSRKAEEDAIDIMEKKKVKKVVMHCFNGRKSLIKRGVDLGFYFSVPPVITRLDHFKMLVEIVPLTQILTETDAPYLSPTVGTRNEPANVSVTISEIAKIKKISEEEVARQIFENAKKVFGF